MTVIDSNNNLNISADSTGILKLVKNDYQLTVTHVSFNSQKIFIRNTTIDTSIYIAPKIKNEEQVLINSIQRKLFRKNFYAGSFEKRGNDLIITTTQLKLGVLIKNYDQSESFSLKAIKFMLQNVFTTRKNKFKLEIKVYNIKNGLLSQAPINRIPIVITSNNLKRNNLIEIDGILPVSQEGFFLSFETIKFDQFESNINLTFPASHEGNSCEIFLSKSNQPNWPVNTLQSKSCLYSSELGGYKAVRVGSILRKLKN